MAASDIWLVGDELAYRTAQERAQDRSSALSITCSPPRTSPAVWPTPLPDLAGQSRG
jgi:hypothetical protein